MLIACEYRVEKIVEHLLARNCPLDILDARGRGILHILIGDTKSTTSSKDKLAKEMLSKIVEHIETQLEKDRKEDKKDPKEKEDENLLTFVTAQTCLKQKKSPLHYCADIGYHSTAAYLIRKNPKIVNLRDREDKTALFFASEKGHTAIVRLLVDNGGNLNKCPRPQLNGLKCKEAKSILKAKKLYS